MRAKGESLRINGSYRPAPHGRDDARRGGGVKESPHGCLGFWYAMRPSENINTNDERFLRARQEVGRFGTR